jgi:plastocyanin
LGVVVQRSTTVAVAAALCSLAIPGVASAATKTVDMGEPASATKAFEQKYGSDANAFFPSSVSVHVGDKVRFAPVGFHTVEFVGRGAKPTPLLSPNGQVTSEKDAAGADFWFNGLPQVGFTPSLLKGLYGKSVSFDGTKTVQSGLPLGNKLKPMTITFKKAGAFTYFCTVHAGMKGTVKVLPKSKPVPSAKADAKRAKAQLGAALKVAKGLAATKTPANTVSIGAAGRGGVESYSFFPSNLKVATGTTVTFTMPAHSTEVHTATTGPGDPEKDPKSYLGTLAASLNGPAIAGAAVYPSDKPGAPAALTPTAHGNGFWNTGALDTTSATPQLPASNKVTFAAPGTYQFYCMIHPFMHGTVTVQ